MRGRPSWLLLVAGLAISALLVHLLVPLGRFTVTTAAGTQQAYLYALDLHYIGGGRVMATGFGAMLTGMIAMVAGSVGMLVARYLPSRQTVASCGAFVVTGIGIGLTLLSQGLWTGRLVSATLHRVAGSDTPPATFDAEGWAGPDVGLTAWVISPAIVLVITLFLVYALGRAWVAHIPDTRQLPAAAGMQRRILLTAAIAFTVALIVPWSSVTLTDATGEDEDLFFWSAYDVLAIHDASEARAIETAEFGILQYRGLSALLAMVAVAGLVLIIGTTVALAGIRLDAMGMGVTGRLLENATFLGVLSTAFLALAAILGAFWLHVPNDLHDATITAMPLLVLIPLGWVMRYTWQALMRLMAEDNDLVADDFPEPIVYD